MNTPKYTPPALDNVVIIDTETGGLDPLKHSIMSVGLVAYDSRAELDVLVAEPKIVQDPRSRAITGLDPEQVARDGLSPNEAVEQIEAWLDGLDVPRPVLMVGHNIAFDVAFMRRLYHLAGRSLPSDFSHRTLDTHTLLWSLVMRGKLPAETRGSDAAFAHFDIAPPPEARHTALGDALATRELLARLIAMASA